jgi:hypothetical protein
MSADGERLGLIRLPEGTGAVFSVGRSGTDFFLSTSDPFPQVIKARLAGR